MFTRHQLYQLYEEGIEPTVRLIESLLDYIEELKHDPHNRRQRHIAELAARIAKLQARLKRVGEKLEKQQCLNYALRRRITELEAAAVVKDSHNSGLPPALDPPAAKAANAIRRTRSLRRPSGKSPGAQPGHPGHTRPRVERPDQVVTHAPSLCRSCGASLSGSYIVRCESRQVIDLPPVKPWVVEHRSLTKRCASCDALTRGRFPQEVKATVQYGRGVRARAVYLVNYQLLPYRRASELLADFFSCPLSPGSLRRIIAECAGRALLTEVEIKHRLQRADVVHVDETGLRVAGEGRFVHVASTERLTHYACDSRRGKAAMDEIGILPAFRGTGIHDGWPAYTYYYQCRHALCGAHLLRELTYIEESHPHQRGQWAEPMAKLLVEIKAAVEEARSRGHSALQEQQQVEYFGRYDEVVRRGLELNPERTKQRRQVERGAATAKQGRGRVGQSEARKLVARLERCRAEVLRFMTDFEVPFDNNQAERDLRMVKLQQKIGGCFRSGEGAREFCRLRSLISTARKQGHGVLESIEKVLARQPLTLTS
jgi:transposase